MVPHHLNDNLSMLYYLTWLYAWHPYDFPQTWYHSGKKVHTADSRESDRKAGELSKIQRNNQVIEKGGLAYLLEPCMEVGSCHQQHPP